MDQAYSCFQDQENKKKIKTIMLFLHFLGNPGKNQLESISFCYKACILLFGLAKARLKLSQSRSLNSLLTTHHTNFWGTSRHNTKLIFGKQPRINQTRRKAKKKLSSNKPNISSSAQNFLPLILSSHDDGGPRSWHPIDMSGNFRSHMSAKLES